MHHGHSRVWKLESRVALQQARVIPLLDLAHEDIRQHVRRELQFARFDAGDVDHRNHPAHDHWELDQAGLVQFLGLEGGVGSAEIDRPLRDLLDAATRSDGLIVQLDVRLFRVCVGPLRIDRVGERRPGTGDGVRITRESDWPHQRRPNNGGEQSCGF